MKIKDVVVGREYAATFYDLKRTAEWVWLPRAPRWLVLAIRPGGKVVVQELNDAGEELGRPRPELARWLVMPWADAVPRIAEITRDNRAARDRTMERANVLERDRVRLVEIFAGLDLPEHCVPGTLLRPVSVYGDGSGISNGRVEFTTTQLLDLLTAIKEA
jgi:hypothetical protein